MLTNLTGIINLNVVTFLSSRFLFTLLAITPQLTLADFYQCTVRDHVEVNDKGMIVRASKLLNEKTFIADIVTGKWRGYVADNRTSPNKKIIVVSKGRRGMSSTTITTRGGAIGRLADMLVIQTWHKATDKPFKYYDANLGFYSGTCRHL